MILRIPKDVEKELKKEQRLISKELGMKIPLSELQRKMLIEYKKSKYRKCEEDKREYFQI